MERDVGCAPWPEVALKIADDSRGPGSVRSPSGGGLETRGMPRRLGSLREGGHAEMWRVRRVNGGTARSGR